MNRINPDNFDKIVAESLDGMGPDEGIVSAVNPWKVPIGRITWGLILTTLTLNFLWLQYLLPAVGVMLMYQGFRTLRGENRWFRLCWLISGLKLLENSVFLILSVTPYGLPESSTLAVGSAGLAVQLILFFAFRRALRQVFAKAGEKPEHDPLPGAAVWSLAAFLIALSPFAHSWIAFFIMIIAYIGIVRRLYGTGQELDRFGYGLTATPVRLRGELISRVYAAVLLLAVLGGCIYFNHLPAAAETFAPAQSTQARERLASLGYPEEILSDLTDSEIALMADAVRVDASDEILTFDPVTERETATQPDGVTRVTERQAAGKTRLKLTTVYAEMPDRRAYVLHYFQWLSGGAHWQDGITVWCSSDEALSVSGGRLLYDRSGQACYSPFPRLSAGTETSYGFFGASEASMIKGAVSFPFGSKNQRGYVLYAFVSDSDSDNWIVSSGINYVHMGSPLHIPYEETEQRMLNGEFSFSDKVVQHYANYDSAAYLQWQEQQESGTQS